MMKVRVMPSQVNMCCVCGRKARLCGVHLCGPTLDVWQALDKCGMNPAGENLSDLLSISTGLCAHALLSCWQAASTALSKLLSHADLFQTVYLTASLNLIHQIPF